MKIVINNFFFTMINFIRNLFNFESISNPGRIFVKLSFELQKILMNVSDGKEESAGIEREMKKMTVSVTKLRR